MDTWSAALGGYITAMKAGNRADGTVRLHRHYLNQVINEHADPWSVTVSDLQTIMASPTWNAETRKSARSVYQGFYRWAASMGYVEESPAAALAPVRVPTAEPRPAPEWVVDAVVNHADERIRFMGMLAAQLGMRCREIALVHADDISLRRLRVHGKGGKIRTAWVSDDRLYELLTGVRGWAFEGLPGKPMSAGHVSHLLGAALPGSWTAHTLRHRAATRAHDVTRDLPAVSKMLGHSKIETTQRYVAISDDAVMRAYQAAAA